MATESIMLSPPQLAERWGVAPEKVLHLIHSGELVGINLAQDPTGLRPRWRIRLEEIERFEQARSSKPPVRRQRRRHTAAPVKEYF